MSADTDVIIFAVIPILSVCSFSFRPMHSGDSNHLELVQIIFPLVALFPHSYSSNPQQSGRIRQRDDFWEQISGLSIPLFLMFAFIFKPNLSRILFCAAVILMCLPEGLAFCSAHTGSERPSSISGRSSDCLVASSLQLRASECVFVNAATMTSEKRRRRRLMRLPASPRALA